MLPLHCSSASEGERFFLRGVYVMDWIGVEDAEKHQFAFELQRIKYFNSELGLLRSFS